MRRAALHGPALHRDDIPDQPVTSTTRTYEMKNKSKEDEMTGRLSEIWRTKRKTARQKKGR